MLHFHWSKMGYVAWGYSFSVHPFFLGHIRIQNHPTDQTTIKEMIHSLSTFACCLLYIISNSSQYMALCSSPQSALQVKPFQIAFVVM